MIHALVALSVACIVKTCSILALTEAKENRRLSGNARRDNVRDHHGGRYLFVCFCMCAFFPSVLFSVLFSVLSFRAFFQCFLSVLLPFMQFVFAYIPSMLGPMFPMKDD